MRESAPARRRPWLLLSFLVAAAGMLVSFAGLIYGVLTVGVPSQDPTPEMVAREAFHLEVSGWMIMVGAVMLFSGVLAFLAILVTRGAKLLAGRRN